MEKVIVDRVGYESMGHTVYYCHRLGPDEMNQFANLNYRYYSGISSYMYVAATDLRAWFAFCSDHESLVLAVGKVEPQIKDCCEARWILN